MDMHIRVLKEAASDEYGKISLSCSEEYMISSFSYVLDPFCVWRNETVCPDEETIIKVEGKKPKYFLKLFNLATWKEFHNLFLYSYYDSVLDSIIKG